MLATISLPNILVLIIYCYNLKQFLFCSLVFVKSTDAAATLEAYSSDVNEDLPEVEETRKSSKEQVQPKVKLQKQIKIVEELMNYLKEAPTESALISDEKLEFRGKRSDRSPEQVADDTVNKVQLSGGAVRVEKINDFHKHTESNPLLDVGPLAQQCHGSVAVGKNTNVQVFESKDSGVAKGARGGRTAPGITLLRGGFLLG